MRNKIPFSILATTILFLVNSCGIGQDKNEPEYVCAKFIEHCYALEFEEAITLGTETTAQALESAYFAKESGSMPSQEVEVTVIETKKQGRQAVCKVEIGMEGGKVISDEYLLKREGGKWLVHFVQAPDSE